MNRRATLLCGALSLVLLGCGNRDAPASTTADSGAPVTNACINDQDRVGVFRSYCAPDPFEKDAAARAEYKSFAEVSSDCARYCVLDLEARDDPGCVQSCLAAATGGAISEKCLGCREEMVACGRTYCVAECAPGPLELKCLRCMCGDNYPSQFNCYEPYNRCSGLALTYCDELDAGTFDGFPAPNDAGACEQ